ncbi:MAG: archaellin/type IV pilin N-terminal domain-containing protein, partial [Sulfolobales archaeon]
MVGIEAAIVLIAFVLVASALAFVVLNMGMFTTQKTKEVIARAYEESTRAIDIAGNVKATVTNNELDLVAIPIKLTAGARPIDLNKTVVAITVIFPNGTAKHSDNAYKYISEENKNITFGWYRSFANETLNLKEALNELEATWIYVRSEDASVNVNKEGSKGDELLEPGEIVLLVFKAPSGTGAYSRIIVEIKPPQGSTVTIERIVPPKLDSDY